MRRMTRRELVGGTIAPCLASCGRSQRQRSRGNSTITVLYGGDPAAALSPDIGSAARFLVFAPLVAWNRFGELEGRLADGWEHSADFRTWTIHLREGVRWHDGVPVTAHDMKFTLDLLQHPDALCFVPGGYTVEVLDAHTYTITYHRQDLGNLGGALDDNIACWPKHLLQNLDPKKINTWDFWSHPVGCGPYRHVRTVPHTMMELEANPDYFRAPPRIERVVLKFRGTESRGVIMPELLSGNVDAAVTMGPDVISAKRVRHLRVYQQAGINGPALWWNAREPLFRDARVRRALTLATNRRELIQFADLAQDTPVADFLFTRRQLERRDLAAPLPYDPKLANDLLDAAGWSARNGEGVRIRDGRPFRFTLLGANVLAVYAQQQFKNIGVRMDLTHWDGGAVWNRIKAGDFQAGLIWFGYDSELEGMLRGAGYENPTFFELLERTQRTLDPDEKDRLFRELGRTFQTDLPLTLLFPLGGSTIANSRIRGLQGSPYRGDLTQCMEELWVEDAA